MAGSSVEVSLGLKTDSLIVFEVVVGFPTVLSSYILGFALILIGLSLGGLQLKNLGTDTMVWPLIAFCCMTGTPCVGVMV